MDDQRCNFMEIHFTNRTLNGWHRLWILAALIWLCTVVSTFWYARPKIDEIKHRKEFLALVKPPTAMLQCASKTIQRICEKRAKHVFAMPNGYRLLLAVKEISPSGQAAAESYIGILKAEVKRKETDMVVSAALVWFIPALVVLLLGHGIAWVRRGFTPTLKTARKP